LKRVKNKNKNFDTIENFLPSLLFQGDIIHQMNGLKPHFCNWFIIYRIWRFESHTYHETIRSRIPHISLLNTSAMLGKISILNDAHCLVNDFAVGKHQYFLSDE